MDRSPTHEGRPYATLLGAVATAALCGFLVVEALHPPMLGQDTAQLAGSGPVAAAIGLGLLIGDVLLPVPSSLVMVGLCARYGLVTGLLLCWAGGVGATMLGFGLGRQGGQFVRPPEKVERLLARWGILAIVVTRSLPILAETTAVMAGTSARLTARRVFAGAVVGTLPPAAVYGYAGAATHSSAGAAVVFPAVLGVAAALWAAERRWLPARAGSAGGKPVPGQVD